MSHGSALTGPSRAPAVTHTRTHAHRHTHTHTLSHTHTQEKNKLARTHPHTKPRARAYALAHTHEGAHARTHAQDLSGKPVLACQRLKQSRVTRMPLLQISLGGHTHIDSDRPDRLRWAGRTDSDGRAGHLENMILRSIRSHLRTILDDTVSSRDPSPDCTPPPPPPQPSPPPPPPLPRLPSAPAGGPHLRLGSLVQRPRRRHGEPWRGGRSPELVEPRGRERRMGGHHHAVMRGRDGGPGGRALEYCAMRLSATRRLRTSSAARSSSTCALSRDADRHSE